MGGSTACRSAAGWRATSPIPAYPDTPRFVRTPPRGGTLHRGGRIQIGKAPAAWRNSANKETAVKLSIAFGACLALAPLATAFAAGDSAQDTTFVQQAAIGGMAGRRG